MRDVLVAVLLVAAVTAGAIGGYYVGANSASGPEAQTSVVTRTSCTVSGPTNGVVIRVVGGPSFVIAGATVGGEADGYCNSVLQTQTLQPAVTNSSGWASLIDGGFGTYNLEIGYVVGSPSVAENYHVSIPMRPLTTTYVVFDVSTGNVTTHYCEYNLHCYSGA